MFYSFEHPPPEEREPLTLYGGGLLSKWGFSDGDVVMDYLDRFDGEIDPRVTTPEDGHGRNHTVLIRLVKEQLLPAIAKVIGRTPEVEDISTSHNPIRLTDEEQEDIVLIDVVTDIELEIPYTVVAEAATRPA